ncbi:CRISPR-associated helicase/endonuclease Cas3 [Spirosoma knui]
MDFSVYKAKSDDPTFALCMTLEEHTRRVVRAAIELVNRLPFTEDERNEWLRKAIRSAVWHDIGKAHKSFQLNLKKGTTVVSIRHELISLWFCEQFLDLPIDELFAIATHHKGIVSDGFKKLSLYEIGTDLACHLADDPALVKNAEEIVKAWGTLFNDVSPVTNNLSLNDTYSDEIQFLLMKDRQQSQWADRLQLARMRGLLMAADHIGSAKTESDLPIWKRLELTDFYPTTVNDKNKVVRVPFRPFQERMQQYVGDVVLHAPTGSGKTEAALSWVYANQTENVRLFYLLPYTASINAMVRRLKGIYGKDRVTALHSKALDFFYEEAINETNNFQQSEEIARNKRSASRELFYPVKVATLHQVLKHALHGKGWDMSLFDYQNALFIIDEFHTYDAHLTGMMLATLQWLKRFCNAKILLMSATIPKFLLDRIVNELFDGDTSRIIRPNPGKPADADILKRIRHKLICQPKKTVIDSTEQITQILEEDKKTVLIIVNNVSTCQKLSQTFNKYNPKLLHGGFHRKDRKEIEKSITADDRKERPRLLIATQAVEVSLDIDYNVAFIENAPIDALIQRFGRVNRAGKRKKPSEIHLFENSVGNTKRIYDQTIVDETWRVLLKLDGQELSEQHLVDACDEVYETGYTEEQERNFQIGFTHERIINFENTFHAGDWADWVEDVIDKSNLKIDVLCENLRADFEAKRKEGKYIEASQLLVQAYPWECPKEYQIKLEDKQNTLVATNLKYTQGVGYKRIERSSGFNFL